MGGTNLVPDAAERQPDSVRAATLYEIVQSAAARDGTTVFAFDAMAALAGGKIYRSPAQLLDIVAALTSGLTGREPGNLMFAVCGAGPVRSCLCAAVEEAGCCRCCCCCCCCRCAAAAAAAAVL